MAKYEIKFSCGHTETIQLYGKMKDRQRKIEYFEREGLCSECYKKVVAQEEQDVAKKADIYIKSIGGVPELEGSEKQVAWAEKIRKQLICEAIEYKKDVLDKLGKRTRFQKIDVTTEEKFDNVLAYNFSTITSARFYIDNRYGFGYEMLKAFAENMKKAEEFQQEIVQDEDEIAAKEESALKPANIQHDGLVEVTVKSSTVEVRYHNDEDFKTVVKKLKFRWDRDSICWYKEKSEKTFHTVDMAAEVINHLLSAGFIVFCTDDEVKRKAVSGDFNPTTDRWVCKHGNELSISFDRNDEIYNAARKIKYAKYRNGSIKVQVVQYMEVEDFAKSFNFQFSDGAKQLISEYKRKIENADVVSPVSVKKPNDKIIGPENMSLDDLKDD